MNISLASFQILKLSLTLLLHFAQVAVAQRRIRDLKMQDRVRLMHGSADNLDFPHATFDKVKPNKCSINIV